MGSPVALTTTERAVTGSPVALTTTERAVTGSPMALTTTERALGGSPLALTTTERAVTGSPLALTTTERALGGSPLALTTTEQRPRSTHPMMYMSVFPSPTRSPSRSVMSSGGMEEPTFQVMRCTLQADHMGATALTSTAELCYCSCSHNKGISEVESQPRRSGAHP